MVKEKDPTLRKMALSLANVMSMASMKLHKQCESSPVVMGTLAMVALAMVFLSSIGLAFWRW